LEAARDNGVLRRPLCREARHLDVGEGVEDVLGDRRAQVWSLDGLTGSQRTAIEIFSTFQIWRQQGPVTAPYLEDMKPIKLERTKVK
jgi:hypothetical protein